MSLATFATQPTCQTETVSGDNHKEVLPRIAVIGLATSMIGMMALPFAVTGTNLAIPLIKADFGASLSSLSWALSGYSIVIAALTMVGGAMTARIGTLRTFQIGATVFCGASIVCLFAPNVAVLILGRALQGVGGAFVVPSSVAVALVGWPESRRAFAMGVWTGAFPIGSTTAPIISSALITGGQWRLIFAVPLGLMIVALTLTTIIQKGGQLAHVVGAVSPGLPDITGMFAGTLATGLTSLGLVEGNTWGWTNWKTLSAFVVAVVLIPVVISRSRAHPRPFVPVRLFKVPTFRVANIANISVSMVGMAVWLLWPLVMGGLWKYDAWGIGLAMSPTPVLGGAGAIFSSRLVERFGYRKLLTTGAVSLLAATAWFFIFTSKTPDYWGRMFPGLVLTGLGMGLLFSFLNAAALADIDRSDYPAGNATFNTGRFLSGAIGVAGVVATLSGGGSDPVAPFRRAYGFLFFMSIIAFVAIVVLWPRKPANAQANRD